MADSLNLTTFNSPLEAGLRVLALLIEAHPSPMELQKLVFLDFLAVHSADVGGPESLHPPTPHRAAELVLRRDLLEKGALLLMSRGLIDRFYDATGFLYLATEDAGPFMSALESNYTLELRSRARWVVSEFGDQMTDELTSFFSVNLDRWGGEFALASRVEDEAP